MDMNYIYQMERRVGMFRTCRQCSVSDDALLFAPGDPYITDAAQRATTATALSYTG